MLLMLFIILSNFYYLDSLKRRESPVEVHIGTKELNTLPIPLERGKADSIESSAYIKSSV